MLGETNIEALPLADCACWPVVASTYLEVTRTAEARLPHMHLPTGSHCNFFALPVDELLLEQPCTSCTDERDGIWGWLLRMASALFGQDLEDPPLDDSCG